jgi:predicted ABC-type ATPase
VIIAGPNGAGKTTISRAVLADTLGVLQFVNADAIASGLSGFTPEAAAFPAGRIMLARLRELVAARESFAFESTLASRTFAPWLRGCIEGGYWVTLVYVMLQSPDLAVARVHRRVRLGGHSVPEVDIRRRFHRSAANFLGLYQPIADDWQVFDNSKREAVLVAEGRKQSPPRILLPHAWQALQQAARPEGQAEVGR